MNAISWLVKLLFIASLPVLFASIAVRLVSTSEWFYERGFDTYGVSNTTGLDRVELVKAGKALIAYFKSADGLVSIQVNKEGKTIPLFNEREMEHLRDVKDLLRLTFRVGEIAGLFVVAYALVVGARPRRGDVQRLVGMAFQGSVLTLGLLALLGVGVLIDFQSLFVQFHVVSFSNDLWMLDPAKDRLIMMFPAGFWVDATLAVAAITAAQGLVVGGLAYGYLRKRG